MDQIPIPKRDAPTTPYLIAVVVMTLVGVIAVLVIMILRPEKDNSVLIGQVLTLIVPTTAAILALMKSQETKILVNGRLNEFLEAKHAAGFTEGKVAGVATIAETANIASTLQVHTEKVAAEVKQHTDAAVSRIIDKIGTAPEPLHPSKLIPVVIAQVDPKISADSKTPLEPLHFNQIPHE